VNLNGCISRNEVRITHTLKPRFSLGNDTLLCQGQSLTLKAPVNAGVIQWQDGTNTPAFFVDKPGTYKLTITNACGTATDEIQVEQGPCTLQMPTAFTPNGDGLNDVFRVRYPEMVKEFKMLVYDRWGAKVFESSNARVGWDGKRNGILLPAGNYIYTIAYTSAEGKPGTLHGWVMLVR
jgi:gliding motility-associated-like protein